MNIFIKKMSISIKTMKISIKKAKISIEKMNISIEKMVFLQLREGQNRSFATKKSVTERPIQ